MSYRALYILEGKKMQSSNAEDNYWPQQLDNF